LVLFAKTNGQNFSTKLKFFLKIQPRPA